MPDLTIEYHEMCHQLDSHVSHWHVGEYSQSLVDGKVTCTCTGFHFRDTCRHAKQVERNRCTWHSAYSDEAQSESGFCPVCGGDTVIVKVAI